MFRTSIVIVALTLLACACAQPITQRPSPQATLAHPAQGFGPTFLVERSYLPASEKSLRGVKNLNPLALPLFPLLASASVEEYSAVGLVKEEALPVIEQEVWRLHRSVTIQNWKEGEQKPGTQSVEVWPKLNLEFLATESPALDLDNFSAETIDAYLKPYEGAIRDGVSQAGDEFFRDLDISDSWEVSSSGPKPGIGRISLYINSGSARPFKMPIWSSSWVGGDLLNIAEAIATPPAGFFPSDIAWMEEKGFPEYVREDFVRQRFQEHMGRQMYEGVGIDVTPPSEPIMILAEKIGTGSVAIGDVVKIIDSHGTSRSWEGSLGTIDQTDNYFVGEDEKTVYIHASMVPYGEAELRQTLCRASRLAAKKLQGTVHPYLKQ